MRQLRDSHVLLESKLAFLRQVSTLCNPRFGVDRTIGLIMEQLRAFYDADCCLMACIEKGDDGEAIYWSRRVDGLDCEGAMRKTAIISQLGQLFLAWPATLALTHDARCAVTSPDWLQGYDVVLNRKTAAKPALDSRLEELLEARSFVCVPLLHQGQELGRLFVLSSARAFDGEEVEFIHQVVGHVVPILKNMELVDRLARDAAQEERLSIARDIHDSVVQPYIGLQMGIESLRCKLRREPTEAARQLLPDIERLDELCRSGTAELRGYIEQLKSARENEENLLAAVRRLAANFEAATGICVHVEAEPNVRPHPRLAVEILQMVAEGLSNIRRHTRSETAILRLTLQRDRLVLKIENCNKSPSRGGDGAWIGKDGPRFLDPEIQSFTPVSLSERAWSLGGCIDVDADEAGARITIAIPL